MKQGEFHSGTPSFVNGIIAAGRIIQEPADLAQRIYDRARQAAQAQGHELELAPMFIGMLAAQGILYAHAAEVAMKTVLQQSGRDTKKTRGSHHLGLLFQRLPDDVKEYAEKKYEQEPSVGNRKTLSKTLNEIGNASIALRYLTEERQREDPIEFKFPAMQSVALSSLSTIQGDGKIQVPDTTDTAP